MRTQLALLLLVVARVYADPTFDLAALKQQYQTQVGVPYKNAVTIVATDVIEYLAQAPVPATAAAARQVAANLSAQAESLSSDLAAASNASDAIRTQLDAQVESLVSQASGVQTQIQTNEQQLQAITAQIQQATAQIADAQNQVNAAQQGVKNAQDALNRESDRVKKAEHCIGIGGWLGRHVCKVIDHSGLKHAEQDRDRCQADLTNKQQRLAQFQAQLHQYQQNQAASQQAKTNLEATKTQLTAQLSQLNQARDNVNNVDTRLKSVVTYLGTLLGKSQVLADVVKGLIDMETVINPLTAIADQVISFSASADDVAYLNAMKQKITTDLPLVQKKLAQYALIPPK